MIERRAELSAKILLGRKDVIITSTLLEQTSSDTSNKIER